MTLTQNDLTEIRKIVKEEIEPVLERFLKIPPLSAF